MSTIKFRNRFKFYTQLTVEEIKEKLYTSQKNNNKHHLQIMKMMDNHLVLKYAEKYRNFFTPQMDINIETENNRTLIRCLIGPAPNVWTMFTFAYGSLGMIAMFSGLFWLTNYTLKKETLWYLPTIIATLFALVMFIAVSIARQSSRPQMEVLKVFLDESLECDCFKLAEES